MAKYSKKRQRELKKDQFRDKTMAVLDRIGDRLEGKGRIVLYAFAGLVGLVIIFGVYTWWSNKKSQEVSAALGRAIDVASRPVQPSPAPGSNQPSFPSEQARAESAIAEFQKVADKYSGQPRDIARYFIAAHRLSLPQERQKGLDELKALTDSSYKDVAAQARFALAQAKEADGQMDEAVGLYNQLMQDNGGLIPADTVSLRIASIYEKQGKTKEAVELLFKIAENARKAKSPEGKPLPKSSAAREAETKLQKLDAARFAQLPPEAPSDLPLS